MRVAMPTNVRTKFRKSKRKRLAHHNFCTYNSRRNETPAVADNNRRGNHNPAVKPECGLATIILAEPPQRRKAVRVNVLSRQEQLAVLNLIVEGNSIRSTERLTGVHRDTIMRLIARVGARCRAMMDRWFRNLTLRHLEIDELWTFVLKKQGRVPAHVRDDRIGDQYLFLAVDQDTKLIPSFALGKRTRETTELLIDDLASRMVLPDLFGPGPRPQLSTDGWAAYPNAIEDAFAGRCSHGVLIKDYRNAEMPGRYGPPELVGTERRVISGNIRKDDVCTSHCERMNLTVRTFLKRFTRLALGFSKKLENLTAAVSLFIAHFNFCRWHGSLKRTPAMAAKVTGHPWTMEELLTESESND